MLGVSFLHGQLGIALRRRQHLSKTLGRSLGMSHMYIWGKLSRRRKCQGKGLKAGAGVPHSKRARRTQGGWSKASKEERAVRDELRKVTEDQVP